MTWEHSYLGSPKQTVMSRFHLKLRTGLFTLPYGITANIKRNRHTQHDEFKPKSKHIPRFLKFSSPNSRCPGALKRIGLFPRGLPVSEQTDMFLPNIYQRLIMR